MIPPSAPEDAEDPPQGADEGEGAGEGEGPWFAAAPPGDAAWDLPGPRADRPPPPDPAAWARAEAGQGARLARAAAELARLDERLRGAPPGLVHRLALDEAEALARASGDRLGAGALVLFETLRGDSAAEDTRARARAAWALRRLRAGRPPAPGGLPAFLGVHLPEGAAAGTLAALAARWEAGLEGLGVVHPLTRAAFAHHAWQRLGLSAPGDLLEGGTAAALIGAAECRGGLSFVPLARAGAGPLRTGGDPAARLASWLEGVRRGGLSALLLLDRIAAWRARAAAETADLSGRTPPRLLDALAAAPLLSAEAAARAAGCSRAAAERNLAELQRRRLVRELTGQARFRLWRAEA